MKVFKAQVQLTEGCDKIILWTSKPNPFGEGVDKPTVEGMLTMSFEAPHDSGATYVERNFNVTPEMINRRW